MTHRLRSIVTVLIVIAVMVAPAALIALHARSGAASFGDNERVGRNSLSAARIDIAIGSKTAPVVGVDLAPGDLRRGSLEVINDGSIDLRFSVSSTEATEPSAQSLAPWLEWRFDWSPDDQSCNSRTASAAGSTPIPGSRLADGTAVAGDRSTGADPGDRVLAPGERDVLCIEMNFALDAPNDVQAATISQEFAFDAEQAIDGAGADS